MKKKAINTDHLDEKYNSPVQLQVMLADTQNVVCNYGRGSGKTTEIVAPRMMRIAYSMPRAVLVFSGATYVSLLENILPALRTYLGKHYKKGIHYEVGKVPPKHFKLPYTPIDEWKRTISFPCGTVCQFASVDRPESALGKNAAHVFNDETLRTDESKFTERILPILRGDRQIHGRSPYFGGLTLTSSTPNIETDHDWWLKYEDIMDKDTINKIMYVAYKVAQMKAFLYSSDENDRKKAKRFITKWEQWLAVKRKGQTFYSRASSFSNMRILGIDYIKDQMKGTPDVEKFNNSILTVRANRVKNLFFAKFGKRNVVGDTYKYNYIDLIDFNGQFKKTSRDLKHLKQKKPLYIGFDPGHFMSCVVGQKENAKKFRIHKEFWEYLPRDHKDMAANFHSFFEFHGSRKIFLYYDRAGNKKLYKNPFTGEQTDTDAIILQRELVKLGWDVELMNKDQRVIFHWEHHLLCARLFDIKDKESPDVVIDENECPALISSIYHTPFYPGSNPIEMDKRSEKTIPPERQAYETTQIATAMTYLLFGLYETYLPDHITSVPAIEGL